MEKTYYIIYNTIKRKIWNQPYDTYEGARLELEYQMNNLKKGQVATGWIIKPMTHLVKDDGKKQSKEDKDFKDF